MSFQENGKSLSLSVFVQLRKVCAACTEQFWRKLNFGCTSVSLVHLPKSYHQPNTQPSTAALLQCSPTPRAKLWCNHHFLLAFIWERGKTTFLHSTDCLFCNRTHQKSSQQHGYEAQGISKSKFNSNNCCLWGRFKTNKIILCLYRLTYVIPAYDSSWTQRTAGLVHQLWSYVRVC